MVLPVKEDSADSLARRIGPPHLRTACTNKAIDWFVANEHINRPHEILPELFARFELRHRMFFPLVIPFIPLNLAFGMTLAKRE